ncbi:MAG TPA: hypothetical protein VEY93_04955 [Longimicrobium sp.]|nr:hypothetical protein [Longimicrobium sp.]
MNNVNMNTVVPTNLMLGEDEDETALLHQMLVEAQHYLEGFTWCRGFSETYYGVGVPGVIAVFLFHIKVSDDVVDKWLWIVVGDVPGAYIVPDNAPDPVSALKIYCDLMSDWVDAVRRAAPLTDVFPVNAAPDIENAKLLARRIKLIRTEVIPAFDS